MASRTRAFGGHASRRAVPLVAWVALTAGCALKPPPDTVALKAEALPTIHLPPAWSATASGGVAAAAGWLASFADPQLSAAVAEAIAHNADLRVGAARVD